MTSTTVSQHTTQPLNFGPEWLRVLSTPDSASSVPSSSGSGNVFKFSATKYRYSKDEILALRVNVSERLSDDLQNEILENLKDVESVFRADILDPLALTPPTAEELTKMNALSSYISGRTPGGAGRAGNNSQQSHQDSRNNRGGNSSSNGRGGSSRGRGGREPAYGSNRGNNNNNNSDENGENGNGADDTSAQSSSWSRGSHHSRGGGSFGNRVRSFDDRDQPQTFRRGAGRQTSDGWRRSRGDDDDNNNNEQGEDSSAPVNGSSSWTSRSGVSRRGASNGSMEQRTKSSDKWSHSDDRTGSSSNYESNQPRSGGWRTNSSMSDRDLNSRRPPVKRDRMPEWMDDNNDDDNHLNNATFEQDGTFTRSSTVRQNNDSEPLKTKSHSTSDESLSQSNAAPIQQEETLTTVKPEKPIQQVDTAIVNVPTTSEPIAPTVSPPKPIAQVTIPSWDDDFDHSDVATTVVEATLAEDHDYSPPVSAKVTSRLLSMESNSITAPIIPQPQQPQPQQQQQRAPVIIDDKQWYYKDPQNTIQGPFPSADMERWFLAGYFTGHLPVKRFGETQFSTIQQLTNELGRSPFRTDLPSHPNTPIQKQQQQQQPVVSDAQKFNTMNYVSSTMSNNSFLDDFSMHQQQQQSRQNMSQSMLFNRQTSMPLSTTDRKPLTNSSSMSSQLQAYFHSQQQQQSSSSSSPLFSSNHPQDPAIIYQHQLQRSMSSTNQPQQSNSALYDEMQRSFRQSSSSSSSANNSLFFPSNLSMSQQQQQQQSNDIMTRLTQAMQSHSKEQRRLEQHQQRHDFELERMKLYQQAEQTRLQRDEEERRKYQLEQELASNRQSNLDQLTKSMENKKQTSSMEIDPFLAFQQSIQQAKIEAQQAENIRRYQQQYREQSNIYPNNWTRQTSQNNEMKSSLNFADIQEQEQEKRSRESAAFAHQYGKSESLPIPNSTSSSSSSTSVTKPNSWARTLFADSKNGQQSQPNPSTSSHTLSEHDTNEKITRDSSYNQQATNAPKSRSTPWNGSANTSFQDIQRQQQQMQAAHSATGWGTPPTSGVCWGDTPSSSTIPTKPIMAWTELKPASSATVHKVSSEPSKESLANTRTQDALSKWTHNQLKDDSKDIDVPTLVQLLKDIDNPRDIMEYVQPYIASVSKAKEFANDFLVKRNQLANAEPDLDNERLNQLVMAPVSSNDNNASGIDEGFQLASSNGQKKKAKKMKGHKIDSKQLGFIVNNRPEQREDIDQVPT